MEVTPIIKPKSFAGIELSAAVVEIGAAAVESRAAAVEIGAAVVERGPAASFGSFLSLPIRKRLIFTRIACTYAHETYKVFRKSLLKFLSITTP